MDSVLAFSSSNRPVIIYGETGTGKELWAHAIHLLSGRRLKPLITLNSSHLRDETMALSTLFGHTKGAFTGAEQNRPGAFRKANGGTLFLDEIEAMPRHAQEILLRAIETGEIQPLGSDTATKVDVRIISATNQEVPLLLQNGRLRKDFYYRIATHAINLPPLRERESKDILRLAQYNLEKLNTDHNTEKRFTNTVKECLVQHKWPGNIRELINCVESGFFASAFTQHIGLEHLPNQLGTPNGSTIRFSGNAGTAVGNLYVALAAGSEDFWDAVHAPYIKGDMSRLQVRSLIEFALEQDGDLRGVARTLHISDSRWRKFYLFLYRTIYQGELPRKNSRS
ncbi:MAG: sigma 54-interacting transcriptional regulator [Candidatus Marinimicrobia bacterium]|nr:sigma 54-interacting transcriptional regulator [Candidatus Neomarinimicrobiota bacterium]MCF7828873.1 sigma 54-interacting transcriptional regulator [Candidatus Neomarinimicrobiota bacterium]MCF7880791.1 sigma 54-interacting transcriptional regulator [Candidatus Neomarinimicrobiota bacterium]